MDGIHRHGIRHSDLRDGFMKGTARTQAEIDFHDRVAQLGCISCRQEGNYNPWVSIHHAHGRTKPGAHMWVLPLCEPHHQDNGTAVARHPHKRRWEAKYGKEDDLIRAMWTELGVEFTEPVRKPKPVKRDREKTPAALEVGVLKLRDVKPKPEKPKKLVAQIARPEQLGAKVRKPVAQRSKTADPLKPKEKPSGRAGSKNPFKAKIPKAAKTPMTERQVAYLDERKAAQKAYNSEASAGYKEKAKAAAKARKLEYAEANKDKMDAKKAEAKEMQKKFKERMKLEQK